MHWLLTSECAVVLEHVHAVLHACAKAVGEPDGTRAQPLRAGAEDEDGVRFAAATSGCSLDAMSLQLKLAKWNRGAPFRAVLSPQARLPLPPLVAMRNKLAQSLTLLAVHRPNLQAVHAMVLRLVGLLADVLRGFSQQSEPDEQLNDKIALHSFLQPQPPSDVRFDATLCGASPRLWISAYVLRISQPTSADGTASGAAAQVLEEKHASVGLEGVAASLLDVERALQDLRALNLKLKTFL